MPILEGEKVTKYFGGLVAVTNVDFHIEQNVQRTLEVADRAYVLENGSIVLEGKGKDFLQDKHVREAYLGL